VILHIKLLCHLGSLTQTIRNFAKSLEGWLRSALAGAPDIILKIKVNKISYFCSYSKNIKVAPLYCKAACLLKFALLG